MCLTTCSPAGGAVLRVVKPLGGGAFAGGNESLEMVESEGYSPGLHAVQSLFPGLLECEDHF